MIARKQLVSFGLVVVTAAMWMGCGKKEQPAPAGDAPRPAASSTSAAAPPAIPSLPLAESAQQVVNKASEQAQALIEQTKVLLSEKKYQEASAKLAELANVQLTPEQQQLVDKLEAEIQKGLSSQAVESGKKALGGLLQGK
jgi:outer membrane PBP1 activator LpoA protein